MVSVTGKRSPNWHGACTRRTKIKCVAALVAANLCFFLLCRAALVTSPAPDYALKLQAAVQADAAQQVLGARLLGEEYTPITTTLGSPAAKQLAAYIGSDTSLAAQEMEKLFTYVNYSRPVEAEDVQLLTTDPQSFARGIYNGILAYYGMS